jgi:hypothetical protein
LGIPVTFWRVPIGCFGKGEACLSLGCGRALMKKPKERSSVTAPCGAMSILNVTGCLDTFVA